MKETAQPQPQKQIAPAEQKQPNKKESQETVVSKEAPVDSLSLLREMQARMKDIHFDFDKYAIKSDDTPTLKEVAETLRSNGKVKVVIEGNCDERGTAEYNLALGDRRATAAKEYLLSLGIPSNRMETVSYGKEKPMCTESTEACWAKNRRDHFVLEEGKR